MESELNHFQVSYLATMHLNQINGPITNNTLGLRSISASRFKNLNLKTIINLLVRENY